MTVVWTEEMKAKAAATRAETKRKKEEREAKRQARAAGGSLLGLSPGELLSREDKGTPAVGQRTSESNGFDWKHSSLEEAMGRLGDLRREYDHAAQIVLARQQITKPRWTCWTQAHKDSVPKSVQAVCRKSGEDGKWASRDDGAFKIVDGIRVPESVFCCSAICHELYLKSKPMAALSRH